MVYFSNCLLIEFQYPKKKMIREILYLQNCHAMFFPEMFCPRNLERITKVAPSKVNFVKYRAKYRCFYDKTKIQKTNFTKKEYHLLSFQKHSLPEKFNKKTALMKFAFSHTSINRSA